jgi:hypothetical protein
MSAHRVVIVGFQNRLLVLIRWSISFATRGRGTRLITDRGNAEAAGRLGGSPGGAQDELVYARHEADEDAAMTQSNAGDSFRQPLRCAS